MEPNETDLSSVILSQFVWLGHVILRKDLEFKNHTSMCGWSVESCPAIMPNCTIMVCFTCVIVRASWSCNYAIRVYVSFLGIVNELCNSSDEWLLIPRKLRTNKDLICTPAALGVTILRRVVLTAILYRLQNNSIWNQSKLISRTYTIWLYPKHCM